jgi:uncharacterized protein YndB with AHSA1/START domain
MSEAVIVHMQASPAEVWDLVSDVTRIGQYSPETLEGQWLDGATGPAVGVRFRGHVKRNGRGPMYWTTCVITECVPGESFVFSVLAGRTKINTWGYRLTPSGDGTDVTEMFELAPLLFLRAYWALAGKARGRTNRNNMRTTLERIKAQVERPAA